MSKMKPRSGLVTDGLERAPARGMLRAVGMGDEDWVKPQIGIASSWNEITPCNLSLDRLAKASKKGVIDAGGFISRLEVERSHFEQVAQILVSYKGCQDDSNTAYLSNHAHRSIYH